MSSLSIADNWMIFKDVLKKSVVDFWTINKYPEVSEAIKLLGLKNVKKVIKGCPDAVLIVTEDKVVRIPNDELSLLRCRNNRSILEGLANTSIAGFVPKFLSEEKLQDRWCFSETRLFGFSLAVPVSLIDEFIVQASDFLLSFQKETAKEIRVDNGNFEKLAGADFERLAFYLDESQKKDLKKIKDNVQKQLSGRLIKTVWMHGDYKIENILFDAKSRKIKGVIDWDLSNKEVLPLLDIFFLLIYKHKLVTGESVAKSLTDRYLKGNFTSWEQQIIKAHLDVLGLPGDLVKPMMVLFWLDHVLHRYRQIFLMDASDKKDWLNNNVVGIIDAIKGKI
ncbi:MAG: aminoglycoside phosphotransferase family protein [Candidatus Omnitrophota bacterium]|jgi:hypothetical protein